MSLSGLGTRQKGIRIPVLGIFSAVLLLAALIVFANELVRFAQGRDQLQVDITVAGVPVTGMRISEAIAVWEGVYMQPVELDYQGYPILLSPAEVGFRVNSDPMRAEIQSKLEQTNNYWVDFWNYLWRRPGNPVEVELNADLPDASLREYLKDVAARFDTGGGDARLDIGTMTFGAGASGFRLDVEKSLEAVREALLRPTNRKVKLVMTTEGGQNASMETLRSGILQYLSTKGFPPDGPDTLASIGVIDLDTGQEMWINGDIAYSSMSTVKIPILINIFGRLGLAPDDQTKWLMGASILCSLNDSSNFLIQIPGVGNNARAKLEDGLRQVTATVQTLGAKNTYISAPLYVGRPEFQFSIPAPKTQPNQLLVASPDPFSQTTPEDMAVILQHLYDCAEYGSGLMAVFPELYTQTECKQMIELLSGNVIGRLIELGMPPGTRIAHKNGWGGTASTGANVSDAAIVYSPAKNYILVIYMWERQASADGIGTLIPWEATEEISRIVYNYYNPDQPQLVSRVPENPLGAIDCVMPNPTKPELLDLNNIDSGRYDSEGHILPDACYGYPSCTTHP